MNKLTDEEKDRQVETEIRTAIMIAEKLYEVVRDKKFVKEVPDANTRLTVVNNQLAQMDQEAGTKMYQSFGSAYPIILKFMVQQLMYSSSAMEKFIRGQAKNPGKGMKGFIEHQSKYVYYLHCAVGKKRGLHGYRDMAKKAKKHEWELMNKVRKDLKAKEDDAKNEFEEESVQQLKEKREELYTWINQELEGYEMPVDENDEDELVLDVDSCSDESEELQLTKEEWVAQMSPNQRRKWDETQAFEEKMRLKEIADKKAAVQARKQAVASSFLPLTKSKKKSNKTNKPKKKSNKSKKTKKKKR